MKNWNRLLWVSLVALVVARAESLAISYLPQPVPVNPIVGPVMPPNGGLVPGFVPVTTVRVNVLVQQFPGACGSHGCRGFWPGYMYPNRPVCQAGIYQNGGCWIWRRPRFRSFRLNIGFGFGGFRFGLGIGSSRWY